MILGQKALADVLGVTTATVRNYERQGLITRITGFPRPYYDLERVQDELGENRHSSTWRIRELEKALADEKCRRIELERKLKEVWRISSPQGEVISDAD